jgi:hypothetical protein
MKNRKALEEDDKYMSWDEFKEEYLQKVEYLAKILGLDRGEIVKPREVTSCRDLSGRGGINIDDDWIFVDTVMTHIRDCEDKDKRISALKKLDEPAGARDIFDEIYGLWAFEKYYYCSENSGHNRRRLRRLENRSESGEGDIVDVLCLDEIHGGPALLYSMEKRGGSDPIRIEIRHNSVMTTEDIAEALHYAAWSYEHNLTDSIMKNREYAQDEFHSQQYDARLVGLYNASRTVYRDYFFEVYTWPAAILLAGWLDPKVSLENGIEAALQRGWPELYEDVMEGIISPFEAMCEAGGIRPWLVHEDVGNNENNEMKGEKVGTRGNDRKF